jgi:putative transposase
MKITHGKSVEITDKLSSHAAETIAQWIGCATVIYNQKTVKSKQEYQDWLDSGQLENERPSINGQVAYLTTELPFLKDIPCQIRRSAGAKWVDALNAAKSGLRKHPKVKPKTKKRSCYVTNELFDVQALDNERCVIQLKQDATKKQRGKYLFGVVMPFTKEYAGKALYLSRKGRRFWLSMSHGIEKDILSEADIKKSLIAMDNEALDSALTGYDLGVKRQVTGSDSAIYHIKDSAQAALAKLEAKRIRYQKRYSRMSAANDKRMGSKKRQRTNGERKMAQKIARYSEKTKHIKHYHSHCISKSIAENTPLCAVFEDLKLDNMVRRPKAKQCPETGVWLANGAKAKSGLNKAILSVNLGQIRQFSAYKLAEKSKIMIKVKPHYSSQECSECGYTHKDNRPSQTLFLCGKCQHTANADDNAAVVIKNRGKEYIRSDAFSKEKNCSKISARKNNKAKELSSSGVGEDVSLASQATFVDALHSISTDTRPSEARLL